MSRRRNSVHNPGAQTGRRYGLQSQSKGFNLVCFWLSAGLIGEAGWMQLQEGMYLMVFRGEFDKMKKIIGVAKICI
jgi:hypothetical protein